jgi:NADPH:quinone reductase-like Zn-dependent oxidoreductase
MKAVVYHQYGPPDVLKLEEFEEPIPAANEVVLRVRAASVNPYDWHFMRGDPYPIRLIAGLAKPKNPRLGADVCGEIEAVGKGVTQFKLGDAVFGSCAGAFAEYLSASETAFVKKPESVSFEQGACVGIAGLTALQALRDKGKIRASQKVLVNGAAGGVGTFGVQIAKSFGAHVTGICSTKNLEMVRSIGADRVIDYTQEDFTKRPERYDLILDNVGNRTFSEYKRVLNPEGIYVGAGGTTDRWMLRPLARMISQRVGTLFGKRRFVGILARRNQADLTILGELIATGKITPVISRRYSLSEVTDAIRHVEEGHARGKVVITMSSGQSHP